MVDPEVVRSELKEAFKTFDKSKRGYLDLQQMTKALGCLGEPLSDLEIKQLIKIADKNNDGKIDVDGEYCYSVIVTDFSSLSRRSMAEILSIYRKFFIFRLMVSSHNVTNCK